jgi:high-affinity iron transporter
MLATFVIGLREGLEAALIVGIIAAFLRAAGKSLVPMWWGVALAVILSIAVGAGLDLVEQALPQAAQEGMEALIGAVAVVFVTAMIAWMNAHARDLKRQLEAEAAQALSQTSAYALASMAFLAVLREGFETSVFLLATFSAAQSAWLAAAGAIIGIALAIVIGWGIYVGGLKLNLSRFFRITGAFLILVAAGLVMTSLRSAHEAGWLNAGQQVTANLSWLVAPGSVQSALITGVLGVSADPRLIEVIGWFAYLVPVALFIYWPRSLRPERRTAVRLRLAGAGGLTALALGLALLYPAPQLTIPEDATIVAATGDDSQAIGSASLSAASASAPAILSVSRDGAGERFLPLPDDEARSEQHAGLDATAWTLTSAAAPADAPSSLTLDQIVALSGGRVPIGLNPSQHPGPFDARWSIDRTTDVWTVDGALLDAAERSVTVVVLSGSGLETPRTLTVEDGPGDGTADDWQVSAAYRDGLAAELSARSAALPERAFWAVQAPIALVIGALLLAASAWSALTRTRRAAGGAANPLPNAGRQAENSNAKGATRAAS